MPAFILWGLRVIYRTLGNGVFFCRRCGGDRPYRHRTGRRFITVFFIPLIPLTKTGEHVQCRKCKTRYVTEVLRLPTTAALQLSLAAGMRALVAAILRVGDAGNPVARRRAIEAVAGSGERDYDDDALDADLAEAIRIALADGPLTAAERAATGHLAIALGMTQAQAIGVIALTEQNAGQN